MRKLARRASIASAMMLMTTGSAHHVAPTSAARTTGRNIALLMGVSDYKYLPSSGASELTDLRGPRNDVPRMQRSLERWGFTGDNVRVLTDSLASRQGVLAAFDWLVSAASDTNDAVVVYWSGHGSYAPDEDKDEAKLNPLDTDDEALVPWDARDIHDPRQLVLDDDIHRFLDRLKTKNVTVIVDACFSGTVTRAAGLRARGPLRPPTPGSTRDGLDGLDGSANHVLFTATSDVDRSYEDQFGADSTTAFGVFTYFLTQAMDAADTNARADDLWRDVADRVHRYPMTVTQSPQLEGARTSRLFHVNGDVARLPFVTVEGSGSRLVLSAGAVHGVRVGAEYEVFSPQDLKFNGVALGRIVVDSVHTLNSTAHVAVGGPFPPKARGILARTPAGAVALQRLDVFVDSSGAQFEPDLKRYPWLNVTHVSGAPVEVSRVGSVLHVVHRGRELIAPNAASSARTTITVDGKQRTISGFDLKTPICEPMARAFAAEALTEIENPMAPRSLAVDVRLVPSDQGDPPDRDASVPDTAVIGQRYALYVRIDAPQKSTLYATVALEGLTTEARMIFPRDGTSNAPLEMNSWVMVRDGLRPQDPAGVDVLKVVVDSQQYDFQSLLESMPRCSLGAGQKFKENADPVVGWTAAERRVVFVRSGGG